MAVGARLPQAAVEVRVGARLPQAAVEVRVGAHLAQAAVEVRVGARLPQAAVEVRVGAHLAQAAVEVGVEAVDMPSRGASQIKPCVGSRPPLHLLSLAVRTEIDNVLSVKFYQYV